MSSRSYTGSVACAWLPLMRHLVSVGGPNRTPNPPTKGTGEGKGEGDQASAQAYA